jgi:RimJ/RimL family protein N-acetyltransferase
MAVAHREDVLEIIRRLKAGPWSGAVACPLAQEGQVPVILDPVTWPQADDVELVALLAAWRERANAFFPAQFPVTLEGTHRWLVKQLLEVPERMLFWVRGPGGERLGHLGLYRFDFDERSVELDNVIRGVSGALPGAMFSAVGALAHWSFETLGIQSLCLRVLSDNERAIRLYERCGFHETMRMPLVRTDEGQVVRWEEAPGDYRQAVERYFVTMRLLAPATGTGRNRANDAARIEPGQIVGPHFSTPAGRVMRPTR